jgi:hypothetical protein
MSSIYVLFLVACDQYTVNLIFFYEGISFKQLWDPENSRELKLRISRSMSI